MPSWGPRIQKMELWVPILFYLGVLIILTRVAHSADIIKGHNETTKEVNPVPVSQMPNANLELSSYYNNNEFTPAMIVLKDPSYLVVAPRVVRAGNKYRFSVNILPPSASLVVVATLFKDNIQVDAVERECHKEDPEFLDIMVPSSSTLGNYRLKLEGNEFGWLTGTAFTHTLDLEFSQKAATIIIQTDNTVYKQGSIVRMRVVAVDLSAKLIEDAADILILSPKGVIVKRWISRQSAEGAIILEFPLSERAENGRWTIRVEATHSFAEKTFSVQSFHQSMFEVRVDVPSFLSSDEEFLRGTVVASYPSGAPVVGNVSVRAAWKPYEEEDGVAFTGTQTDFLSRRSEKRMTFWDAIFTSETNNTRTDQFSGLFEFQFHLSSFDYMMAPSEGGEVLITATVGDALWDISQTGFSSCRLFNPHIHLQFLGKSPHVLRPPMPFVFYLTASMADGSHVSSFRLAKHRLMVRPEVKFRSGMVRRLYPRSIKMAHDQYSLWDEEIDLFSELGEEDKEEEVVSLQLEAELKDSLGRRSYASLIAVTHYSSDNSYIQVSTSSKKPKVGEFAIFHVRSNFYFDRFRYILMSKGMIIDGGQESMEASLKTFPLALTRQMSGMSTMIVYVVERGKELVADAITFPVDALSTKSFKVSLEEIPSSGRLKISVEGKPGSRVSLTGTVLGSSQMRNRNMLSKSEILTQLSADAESRLKSSSASDLLQMKWISHDGLPEEVLRLSKASYGADVNQTFSFSDLVLLSDGEIPSRATHCRASRGFLPCLLGGCFSTASKCDRKWDCVDRIDEKECSTQSHMLESEISTYQTHRQSRTSLDFAPPWLWTDLILEANGKTVVSAVLPDRVSNLDLNAFSIHPEDGLNLLEKSLRVTTTSSYWLWVEAPQRVGLWEQIGARVTVVNRLQKDLPVVVVLANNPSYRFLSLQEFEKSQPQPHFPMRHPNAVKRTAEGGEHRHSLTIPSGHAKTIYLPIQPVALGRIDITVEASFPGLKTTKSTTIYVEPMGALQERHTSFLLDLNNRAYLFTFLDVQNPREFVGQDGTRIQVSVFGDVIGGITDKPVLLPQDSLHLPQEGSEPLAFSLMLTLMQLNHWKKLDQKPPKNEKEIFGRLSLLYQTLLSYQNTDGGFAFFESSSRSCVWVTSFILRSLNEISQHWPHLLYVESQVTDKALRFVLKHQTEHGAFFEPSGLLGNRQLEAGSNSLLSQVNTRGLNLSTTALTLIQLKSLVHLPEPLDKELEKAMTKGRAWLEENLELVGEASKPLEVALVVLALHLLKSTDIEKAFAILSRNARQEDLASKYHDNPFIMYNIGRLDKGEQYVYWGEDKVPLPSYRVEDNRPYLQPRQPHRHDSGNVAATACALRVYAARGELLTPAIVRWLQSQRAHNGGWMSTFDTAMAWEALREYSDLENRWNSTRLVVTVEPMLELSRSIPFHVTPTNLLSLQTHLMTDEIESITVQGKGRGSAVLQLSYQYYATESSQVIPAPTKAFQVETRAISSGRNASKLSFQTCISWTFASASESSGITVLDLTVPTGYGIPFQRLQDYVTSRQVPELRSATFRSRLISFYFDKIGPTDTCVEFSVDRWYPVANLTRILPVKVYEYYSPELYAVELLDMSSITLDICQVCGSYQCPNCPVLSYYSSKASTMFTSFNYVLLSFNVYHLLFCSFHYLIRSFISIFYISSKR